jgi:MFS family permease
MKPRQFVNERTAQRNIRLLVVQKIFAKRVFLPLTAIYFMEVAGFTVHDIGLIAAVFAFTGLVAELPTGYFADRVARVTSIRIAALLNICSTLLYVLAPTKPGIFAGFILEAVGYSFLAGAGEALLHDTLVWQKRAHDYTRIVSKAQAISLIANAVLLAFVPMTYAIDKRLPFLLGTVAYIGLLIAGFLYREVERVPDPQALRGWRVVRQMLNKPFLIWLAVFGIISGLYTGPSDFFNLALIDFGLRPEMLGWLFSATSVVGAAMGPFIHHLKRLSLPQYMLFDCAMMISILLALLSRNLFVIGFFFITNFAFWRYRKIVYQDFLLSRQSGYYKATLLSLLNNITQLNEMWVPLAAAASVSAFGLQRGLGYLGLASLVLLPLSFGVSKLLAASMKPAKHV